MAERFGLDLRRLLASAERSTDCAIFFGSDCLKTFFFKSIASLVRVTLADHFFVVAILGSPVRWPCKWPPALDFA